MKVALKSGKRKHDLPRYAYFKEAKGKTYCVFRYGKFARRLPMPDHQTFEENYAATQIDDFTRKIIYLATGLPVDKTAGQTANASETLTAAWWLIPATILGAAIWALLIVEVMG